jgi:periplasmic protein TonB
MRLWLELPAFGALAAGLHVALFAGLPAGAPEAAGDGGAGTLTLAAAPGAVSAMVAAWEAPPAAPLTPAAALPPAPASASPGIAVAPSPPPSPAAALALPEPEVAPPAPRPATAAPEPPASAVAPPSPESRPRARPAQVAAGAGATGLRGARGEAPVAGLSDSARRAIIAAWGAEIRARVEAGKVHPEGLRASGRPVVRITVARSGTLEEVRIVASSRVAALDEAALRAVRRAGSFPAAPRDLDLARASFDLPIAFTR